MNVSVYFYLMLLSYITVWIFIATTVHYNIIYLISINYVIFVRKCAFSEELSWDYFSK